MTDFVDLIGRIRAGDQDAAVELVRRYEPTIRRIVRLRLVDPRLARVFDSMDVCQSVLASFFVRATAGAYDLDTPDQLVRLLAVMARNKLANQARKVQAERRGLGQGGEVDAAEVAASDPSPSQLMMAAELQQAVWQRLSIEEQQLVELRRQGHHWTEISRIVGDNPVALRKRLSRALNRVSTELGLDESTELADS